MWKEGKQTTDKFKKNKMKRDDVCKYIFYIIFFLNEMKKNFSF
jgi:hypothetical protein